MVSEQEPRPMDAETLLRKMFDGAQRMVVLGVMEALCHDLDVTDDVVGRDLHRSIHRHLGGRRGDYTDEFVDWCTPVRITQLASIAAKNIRRTAAVAVAAALDELPTASDRRLTDFVRLSLLEKLTETYGHSYERDSFAEPAQVLACGYATMCRRSGLTPLKWTESFAGLIQEDHWAFRRDISPEQGAPKVTRPSPLSEEDAAARFAYYVPWVFEGGCGCPSEPSTPLLHVLACPTRLFVVLSKVFPSDRFAEAFRIEWPGIERKLRADFERKSSANKPTLLERLTAGASGGSTRPRILEQLVEETKAACLDHWRAQGRAAVSELNAFGNIEGAIAALFENALRDPDVSDLTLVVRARAMFLDRTRGNPRFPREEMEAWVGTYITTERVPEARRRSRENAAGRMLASTEADLRTKGMSAEEVAAGRDQLVDLLLFNKKT
jgi:hypothetical protein